MVPKTQGRPVLSSSSTKTLEDIAPVAVWGRKTLQQRLFSHRRKTLKDVTMNTKTKRTVCLRRIHSTEKQIFFKYETYESLRLKEHKTTLSQFRICTKEFGPLSVSDTVPAKALHAGKSSYPLVSSVVCTTLYP